MIIVWILFEIEKSFRLKQVYIEFIYTHII